MIKLRCQKNDYQVPGPKKKCQHVVKYSFPKGKRGIMPID